MIMLDIGCGEKKRENSIGCDRRRTGYVDVIADAHYLPFKDGMFDHIYSSHVIEHFGHQETKNVLIEWTRVLKLEGVIEIRCPWLRARALLFALFPTWDNVRNIYGGQEYEGNYHKCGFSSGLLKNLLKQCGIKNIKRIYGGYKGIPFIPDCLHIRGIKKNGIQKSKY